MKLKTFIVFLIFSLLFSSCSNMRFGHLAKVKSSPKNNLSVINHSSISFKKNDSIKFYSIILEENNFERKVEIETQTEEILLPKTITPKIPKKIIEQFDNFQTRNEIPINNKKKSNANAIIGFSFAILALFCMFGLIYILSLHNLFAILLALAIFSNGQVLFSLLAIIFGWIALAQISNNPEYYTNKSLAIIAIIMGVILIGSLFFLLA